MPSMSQAGSYSGTLAYLAAVARTGRADDGAAVVSAMRAAGVFDDPLFGKTSVRADGRVIHDMYLVEVKKPSESIKPYDYYKVVSVIPATRRSVRSAKVHARLRSEQDLGEQVEQFKLKTGTSTIDCPTSLKRDAVITSRSPKIQASTMKAAYLIGHGGNDVVAVGERPCLIEARVKFSFA